MERERLCLNQFWERRVAVSQSEDLDKISQSYRIIIYIQYHAVILPLRRSFHCQRSDCLAGDSSRENGL